MRAARNDVVRLESTIEAAEHTRDALLRVRDFLPEGEDRDIIIALAVQIRYALEDIEKLKN